MDLRERIIRTVSYFDLFDRPLSRAEIFDLLYGKDAAREAAAVNDAITALAGAGKIKEAGGLVFLFDRDPGLATLRVQRRQIAARKLRRARRWAGFFSALPGVRLVGIGNTLAYQNAKDESDIDFFIVTAPGMIWRTRFFCAAAAALFDLRPRAGNNRDKLCLSFFVTERALDLSSLKRGAEDVYMDYWIRLMMPLAGSAEARNRYRRANGLPPDAAPIGGSHLWRFLLFPVACLPGAFMKGWQLRHFPAVLRAAAARHDGSVVVTDDILKFHVTDRRADIYEKWKKRVNSIL